MNPPVSRLNPAEQQLNRIIEENERRHDQVAIVEFLTDGWDLLSTNQRPKCLLDEGNSGFKSDTVNDVDFKRASNAQLIAWLFRREDWAELINDVNRRKVDRVGESGFRGF